MARHLSDANIKAICELLDGWRGSLTWEALVKGVEGLLGQRYTRQALNSHERIRLAYSVRRKILQAGPEKVPKGSVELRAAQDRIARLEAENKRIEKENERLLGQFATWLYNATSHGLHQDILNKPFKETDRDRTKVAHLVPKGGKKNG